jgi:hypothetical protein
VIEYCGEVMSDKVAQSRLRAYEVAGTFIPIYY